MFESAVNNDIPELRELWKKCFDADRTFLDLFFGKGYSLAKTFVLTANSRIISALSVFPVRYAGHNGGYVYGVCTHPDHRGHRYAVSLLQHVEILLLDKELDFLVLRPATPTLFDYYRKQGYNITLYRSIDNTKLPPIPADVALEPLSGTAMYAARASQCRAGNLFEWSPEMCGYLLEYLKYCDGKAYSVNHGENYVLCYPDPENIGNIICEESGETVPGVNSDIGYWTKRIYPNADTATIIVNPSDDKKEYALCKSRVNLFSAQHPLFTFAME